MQNLKLLDDSAGTLTLEEQLALTHTDSSSAIITGEGSIPHSFLQHHSDYAVMIFLCILNLIVSCTKAKLPIAQVIKPPLFYQVKRYKIKFSPEWESLINKIQPAFYYQFNDCYTYSEEIKAWIMVRDQFSEHDLQCLANPASIHLTDLKGLNKYVELLNLLIKRLSQQLQSASFKKKIRERNTTKNQNKIACVELFNSLIAKFAKVLVIRMDFSLKRNTETILQHASSMTTHYSRHDLKALKAFMKKFKNNWRNKKILNEIEGYIFQYEYSHATGFHIHAYFFFDGNKHQKDINIALFISEYWKKITNNQGCCFICNMQKERYRQCGIGMIHYSDLDKQSYLIKTFDYICKADQFFIFSELLKVKRFQRSQLPRPKANAGRSRTFKPIQQNTTH